MKSKVGIISILFSALLFGVTPILTAVTYTYGNNGLNMAFFRNLICIPILFLIGKLLKHSFRINRVQLLNIIFVSILGSAATTILLYSSYAYVTTGIATVLHFTYPVFTILLVKVLMHQDINKTKKIAVILSLLGLLCFIDLQGNNQIIGIVYALMSGLTYAFYIVWVQKVRLIDISPYVLSFYLAIISAIFILILNSFMDFMVIDLGLITWMLILIISVSTSFIATVLLQKGLQVVDGASASILCLLEPLSSFVLGIIFQGEVLTLTKVLGFGFIIGSIVVITLDFESTNSVS